MRHRLRTTGADIIRYALVLVMMLAASGCMPRVQTPDQGRDTPRLDATGFITSDGAALPLRRWLPAGPPSSILIAVHGYSDYSHAFEIPANYMAEHGVAVYAYDQRGFGEAPHAGVWPGEDLLTRDLREFVTLVVKQHPRSSIFVLGASMGAAVTISGFSSPAAPPVDGLVLVAPAAWGGETFNGLYRAIAWLGAHTVPWLKISGRHIERTITDNPEALADLRTDPHVQQKVRLDSLYGLVHLMDAGLANASKLNQRVLVLYGMKDEVIPKYAVCTLIARLATPATTVLYPDGYHLLLRDLQHERVLTDILRWLDDPRAPLGTGIEDECD